MGQDGTILNEILKNEYEVHGVCRIDSEEIKLENFKKKYCKNLHLIDLSKKNEVGEIIKKIDPEIIINFAGETNVINPWENVRETFEQNFFIVSNILEEIKKINTDIFFFQSSSSLMYARSNEIKIDENSNFSPMYPYGISKLSSHLLVNEYRKKFNIKCSSGIFFNHESPYRNEKFLSKKVSNFVKKILLGEDLKINLNNLNIYRDISHAEDFMKGVKIIVENKVNEDFIFSSGELISMKKFVNLFFEMFNLNFEDYLIYSEENNETYKIYGDNSKLKSLGWNPEFRIEDLVRQMVEIS